MRKIMALAVIGATLALAVPAQAEEQTQQRPGAGQMEGRMGSGRMAGHRGEMMKRLDTNGDGAVSKDEFLAGANERFAKMDRNGDGKLTQEDRPQRPEGGGPNGGRQGGGDAPPEPPADGGGE